MQRKYTIMITSFILFGLLCPAIGQTQSNAAQYANTIAPFVDDQTFAVARLDVSRLDIDAIVKQTLEFLPDQSEEIGTLRQEITQDIYEYRETAKQGQQTFIKAGGRDIYGVYSMYDVPYFFVAVPLAPQADVPTITNWLVTSADDFNIGVFESARIGNVLVAGRKETMERIRTRNSSARPELAPVFAATGDAAVQVLLLPTQDQRRVIEEMMPTLSLPWGEIPSTTLTQGIIWASLGVNLPPQMSLNLKVKSQDVPSVQMLKNLVDQLYILAGSFPEIRKVIPNLNDILEHLKPTVNSDQLELVLSNQTIETDIMKPIIKVALEEMWESKCRNQLRGIGNAFAMYNNDFDGLNPPDLKALIEFEDMSPKDFVCPHTSDKPGQISYIYRGVDLNHHSPANMILVHDKKGNHKGYRNVLFSGGYVERMTEEKFQDAVQRDNELRKKNKLLEKSAD